MDSPECDELLQCETVLEVDHNRTLDPETLLIIEPFYGGSHKQLVDALIKNIGIKSNVITLSPKKWHWRARCGALVLSTRIPSITTEQVLFTTSMLNLSELIGLRPDIGKLKKIVYFHENQLVYPVREIKERDIQYAYNQIVSCLTADIVVFNSIYNKNTFLCNIKRIIKMMPDYRPKDLHLQIEPKCRVLYFPIDYSAITILPVVKHDTLLHIVWPHRWEFDKNPQALVNTLLKLKTSSPNFYVSIIGETFHDIPEIMLHAKQQLTEQLINFGFVESKEEYFKILQTSHVAISTAHHEFFGVSMLEATFCGCFPLVPNKLVYPEVYPKQCLYSDDDELFERLKEYCANPSVAIHHRQALDLDFNKFSTNTLIPKYIELFK